MKKFFLFTLMLLGMSIAAVAQVKVVWSGPSGLEVQFKRCYVRGNQCNIVFLIANNMSTAIAVEHDNQAVYDDEGNVYDYTKADVTLGGSTRYIEIPTGTFIKGHVTIDNFDEYAAKITTLKMDIKTYAKGVTGRYPLEIKNIPVARD